jgi:hypothetical protein
MNRYVVLTSTLTLPLLVVAGAFAFRGTTTKPAPIASPSPAASHSFGLLKAVGADTVTIDPADLLSGKPADRYAAAHGLEVPVANDVLIANEDTASTTFPLAPDAKILLMNWSRCCVPEPAGREQLAEAARSPGYGYWITVRAGVVTQIEEQYHP